LHPTDEANKKSKKYPHSICNKLHFYLASLCVRKVVQALCRVARTSCTLYNTSSTGLILLGSSYQLTKIFFPADRNPELLQLTAQTANHQKF